MTKGVSIIICCYNSASRIEETLRFIFNLVEPPNWQIEVLLVNNNSNDATVEVAWKTETLFNSKGFAFNVIQELTPGLSFARMAGVNGSNHDLICFCDDDNHLSSNYFIVAAEILEQYPKIGIMGGLALPKFGIPTGDWIKDFYRSMAIGPQAPQDGFVNWVYGAGMILKKEVFSMLKGLEINLILNDRTGNVLTSGGDSEICCLVLFLNFGIFYSSRMTLFHAIPTFRLKKSHYMNASFNTIHPSIYLYILNEAVQNRKANCEGLYLSKLSGCIRDMLYFLPRMVFGKHNFYSLFMFYRTFQTLFWLLLYRKRFKEIFRITLLNLKN